MLLPRSVVMVLFLTLLGLPHVCLTATAAEPVFTVQRTGTGGVEVKIDGKRFAIYQVDQANKPYLWPIYGPTGKAMTRAYPMESIDGEQHDHPHHRGITFGHERYGGSTDTWHERATFEEFLENPKSAATGKARMKTLGAIKHREFTAVKAEGDKAIIAEICDHVDAEGKKFLTEERRIIFHVMGEMRAIDFDQDLIASDEPVKFDDRKDSGLSIRVPSALAVDSRVGGRIVNSSGLVNDAAWGKPALWCDYNGTIDGERVGIAMLNHPTSFRHPTPWHVRTYGLFTANPFGPHSLDKTKPSGAFELAAGRRIKLRHRFLFHVGDEKAAKIAKAYEAYAKETK